MDIFSIDELAKTVIDQAHTIRLLNQQLAISEAERARLEAATVAREIVDASRGSARDASLAGPPDVPQDGATTPRE